MFGSIINLETDGLFFLPKLRAIKPKWTVFIMLSDLAVLKTRLNGLNGYKWRFPPAITPTRIEVSPRPLSACFLFIQTVCFTGLAVAQTRIRRRKFSKLFASRYTVCAAQLSRLPKNTVFKSDPLCTDKITGMELLFYRIPSIKVFSLWIMPCILHKPFLSKHPCNIWCFICFLFYHNFGSVEIEHFPDELYSALLCK